MSSYGNDAYTLSVNSSFHAKTVEDLRTPDRPRRNRLTGAGATNGIFTNIAKDVLGLNIQHVRGYRGAADVFLAQQRNELDGQVVGLVLDQGRAAGAVEGGRVPAAGHVRTHHALPRIPRRADRARADERSEGAAAARFRGSAVLHGAAAGRAARPAGRPRAALQSGFMAMTKDPAFVAEAHKMSLDLSPIDGEAVRKVIAQMAETPPDVIAQLKEIASAKN